MHYVEEGMIKKYLHYVPLSELRNISWLCCLFQSEQDEDYSEVINDPAFLQSVLEGLPGVDPQSEAIRNAMGALTQKKDDKKKDDKKKDESKKWK